MEGWLVAKVWGNGLFPYGCSTATFIFHKNAIGYGKIKARIFP